MERAKLLDRIGECLDNNSIDFAVTLLCDLAESHVVDGAFVWQAAIKDQACMRLPIWRCKDQRLHGLYDQLRGQLQDSYKKLKALQFPLAECQQMIDAKERFHKAATDFQVDQSGSQQLHSDLVDLVKWKEHLKLFRVIAAWHVGLAKRLEKFLEDVRSIEAQWKSALACDLRQQCEPLIQEMPQAVVSVVRAIDASPVLLERAVGTMTSQDVSIPEIVECVSFSWIYILRSLLFGEITLKDAEILLEIGQRKQLKIAEWLRLELSAARQLGQLEEDVAHCDRQAIESNLTRLSQFTRYSSVLSDMNTVLKTLQKRGLLVQDDDLKRFETQLQELKVLQWDSCHLRDIEQYSKSHVLDLDVCSREATLLQKIVLQKRVMEMLVEGQLAFCASESLEIFVA